MNLMILNMKKYDRAMRIVALIDRLDRRGSRLMYLAIEAKSGPGYEECLLALKVVRDRCVKLAIYINHLPAGPRRRTA